MNKSCIRKRAFTIFLVALLVFSALAPFLTNKSFETAGQTISTTLSRGTSNPTHSVTPIVSTPYDIFYAADGYISTTSSTNSTSPIAGIPINTNSTLKFFEKDGLENVGYTGSAHYKIVSLVIPMNDTTASYGLSTYSDRKIQAEYVSKYSSLLGKSIDTILVNLKRVGSPMGTVQVGVFNNDLSVKALFGTMNASAIATSYKQYSFFLPPPQTYQIQSGDRIGIKFTGGDASNFVAIMTDQINSFDGINSYLTYYTTSWKAYTGVDLTMTLDSQISNSGPTVSATPPGGTYNSTQSVTLTASIPATIYYTADGSTPTTSSTNGTSPITGIIINTNSTLKFFAKDVLGNIGPVTTQIYIIIKSNSPTITLKGSNPITIPLNSVYIDPGATATDSVDGNITGSIVTKSNVNTSRVGTYAVTYKVVNSHGSTTNATRTVNVIDTSPVVQMRDIIATYGLSVYSGMPIQAEYVSNSSSLVNKKIDTITVQLKRVGAPTGTVQVGVFNDDLSVKKLFGTVNDTFTIGNYNTYTFSLPAFQTYQIQAGDRIGIKYAGGDARNVIGIMTDQKNNFDGVNSYLTYYAHGVWNNFPSQDITMTLEQGIIQTDAPIITPPNDILSVTTNSSRNIPDLGTPLIIDPHDTSPTITSNSTGAFVVGKTTVSWRAVDSLGNVGMGFQKINVIQSAPPSTQFNRVAMINFDDAYESQYTNGKPILDKYNIKATFYVICGWINMPDYMVWPQIHELKSQGHDVQGHTMNHLHPDLLTQSQLNYEYGNAVQCMANNGTAIHMVALPYNEGYNDATVINTIAKYYDMARGGIENTFFLHCNDPLSTETDCRTFDSSGHLTQYNRYNIRSWSQDALQTQNNYEDIQTFSQFIQELNSASTNTGPNSTEVPVIAFHRVVLDNSKIFNSGLKGTSTKLLDAEMKYLVDNKFKIWTTANLAYDPVKNWFYFKG